MIRILSLLLALVAAVPAAAEEPLKSVNVSSGEIVDLGVLQSKFTDPRRVVIWLPSSYRANGPRHAVLYMHDGQNLFDKGTAGYGMEWEVDEHLDRLIAAKKCGRPSSLASGTRRSACRNMSRRRPLRRSPTTIAGKIKALYGGDPLSDGYLKFIVQELKPRIEREFRVKPDRANTVIMGSSMGALISLYAIDEYPKVFGGAGMMSTHWPLLSIPTTAP